MRSHPSVDGRSGKRFPSLLLSRLTQTSRPPLLRRVLCLLVLGILGSCSNDQLDGVGVAEPASARLPEFPWPPPASSARAQVPIHMLRTKDDLPATLGDIAEALTDALEDAGYAEYSFLHVPRGFALVTRLEQTRADGSPLEGSQRWVREVQLLKDFSLQGYIRALFSAPIGYYRVIAFVATPHSLLQDAERLVNEEEAMLWLWEGGSSLPDEIRDLPADVAVTALIYEFERPGRTAAPLFRRPGRIPARAHLENARIWAALIR